MRFSIAWSFSSWSSASRLVSLRAPRENAFDSAARPRVIPGTRPHSNRGLYLRGRAAVAGIKLEGSLTEALIYMVMVVSLSIFVSNSGVISFGHVTFALVGAYASAWQTCCAGIRGVFMPGLPEFLLHANIPVVVAMLIAASIATVVAAIAGLAVMRLNGVAASIALLSLLFVLKTIYENWSSMTAGQGRWSACRFMSIYGRRLSGSR